MEEHCEVDYCRSRSRRSGGSRQQQQQQQQHYPHDTKYRISTRHLELMSEEMNRRRPVGTTTKQDKINVASLDTPCRKIASLKLDAKVTPKPMKQSKLLSSKSLSQLLPRKLFFLKQNRQQQATGQDERVGQLQTTRSLTNAAFQCDQVVEMKDDTITGSTIAVKSASLVGFPRHSTCTSAQAMHGYMSSSNSTGCCSLTQPNISPIVGENVSVTQRSAVATSTPQETVTSRSTNLRKRTPAKAKELKKTDVEPTTKSKAAAKPKTDNNARYKPFKNTALVLRDVKNSIGVRMKAKQQSKAFAKLDEEVATPPSKLYSPFHIYTPDTKLEADEPAQVTSANKRVRRQLTPKLINLESPLSSNWLLQDRDDSF